MYDKILHYSTQRRGKIYMERGGFMVVIISTEEYASEIKSSIKSQNYEIANTLWESSYKEGVKLINQNADEIDAIIIDASLEGNVLELLLGYEKESLLSKTIIIDNLKLDCYNLIGSKYQLYNVISPRFRVKDLIMYIDDITEKSEKANYKKLSTFEEIAEILKTLGVAPDKNGFHYLRKAIYECYLNPKLLTSVTKEVYPLDRKSVV